MPFTHTLTIRLRSTALALSVVAASLLLLACSQADPTTTPTATPTSTVTGGDGADAPSNVDLEACDGIEPLVASAFPGMALLRDATAFETGAEVGQGCRVLVMGDADELPTFTEVAQALQGALEADGWVADPQYAADGPTGTQSVYEKGEDAVVVAAGVAPKDPTACPSDQIIGDCLESLEPQEILVQGSIILRIE